MRRRSASTCPTSHRRPSAATPSSPTCRTSSRTPRTSPAPHNSSKRAPRRHTRAAEPVTSTSVRAEFPDPVRTPPAPRPVSRTRSLLLPLSFLGPALLLLTVWVIYPALKTIQRSFWSELPDSHFVWFQNYDRMFSDHIIRTAIRNNIIWIAVAPLSVTLIGLVLAVLIERIWWQSALKVVLFMPLAISLFAVGVIWRIMYLQEPDKGVINASLNVVHNTFRQPGV